MRFRLTTVGKTGLLCCLVLSLLGRGQSARAVEPFERFLEGLRDRGYHDMALEYLDSMRTSPLITAEQQTTIPYEEARTLVDAARAERDLAAKNKLLDQASDKFREFVKANSAHPLAAGAETQLGNVLVERGRGLWDASQRPSHAQQKEQLLAEARKALNQAKDVFSEAERKFSELLKTFPKFIPESEQQQIEARDQARGNLIQAQLFHGAVLYELSKTYDPTTDQGKALLQQAADKYEKVYQDYRTRLAGLMARLKQGQCYQDMGDTKRALGLYRDILGQPDEIAELAKLKASAMYLSLQCWTDDKEKMYELATIESDKFLNSSREKDLQTSEWLAVRYYAALANKLRAEELSEKQQAAIKKQHFGKARDYALAVSKVPGGYQEAARALVRELLGKEGSAEGDPTNFVAALDLGRTALDEMMIAEQKLKSAPAMNDQQNIPTYQAQIEEARAKTLRLFHLAMDLRDESTELDDINIIRYYLCYLNYIAGHHYDAAVLGEFLSRHYPEGAGARPGAKIAMAAYVAMYSAAAEDQRDFDRQRMLSMAEYITKRWAGEAEADEAWSILMAIATNERDVEKTLEYLDKIPENSPRRGEMELKAGTTLWGAYLKAMQLDEAQRPPLDELSKLGEKAKETLEKGIQRMGKNAEAGKGPIDPTLASAALSLAQMYVNLGEPGKAIPLLIQEKYGPLSLAEVNDPVTEKGNFKIEAYKLALRAYVSTQDLKNAEDMMKKLEAQIETGGAGSAAELTKIYIALGRELEEQVSLLKEEGKTDQLRDVTKGFELFLDRISAAEAGSDFRSLNWVAQTFYSLGSGFDSGSGRPTGEALKYYQRSIQTDEKIQQAAKANAGYASADTLLAVRMRTSRARRRLGQFKEAVDELEHVLRARPQLLDAQTEAAYTYQDWGGQNPAYYNSAIIGARPTKDAKGQQVNTIWGWARLAMMVQSDKRYTDVYHQARYELANCRMLMAKQKSGAEKADLLKRAEADIFLTNRLKPDMGGPEWTQKYDGLLKEIQRAGGNNRPTGLEAFKQRTVSTVGAR